MSHYSFVTVWKLKAPLEAVWNAIRFSKEWPSWWKGVLYVREIVPGDATGTGTVSDSAWRGVLPYTLRFRSTVLAMESMRYMEGRTEGDLAGRGRWYFSHANGLTTVRYEWEVETTARWMNWMAPVFRSIFKWNHDAIMKRGMKGLVKKLGTKRI